MVVRILFDPRNDLPTGTGTTSSPCTVEATPTRVREDGNVIVIPSTLTFTVNTAADVVQLPAPLASWAWRLTVRQDGVVKVQRTVRFPDTASIPWASLQDVDPASLQPGVSSARQWDATFAQLAALIGTGSGGGGTITDATTTSKGVVQLAGDLAGTAAIPTVPGLTGKKTTITQQATQTVSFTAAAGNFYPVNASAGNVTVTLPTSTVGQEVQVKKLDSNAATGATVGIVNVTGKINGVTGATVPLRKQGLGKQYLADGAGGWTIVLGDVDITQLGATTGEPGFVQLAGDLGGTAALPTVPGLPFTRLPGYDRPPTSLLLEAAPAAGAIVTFSGDDFAGAASTSLAGRAGSLGAPQNWTVLSGTWQLDGAGAVAPTAATDGFIAVTSLPTGNRYVCTVQVTAVWRGTVGGAAILPCLIVRWVDVSNFWYLTAAPHQGAVALYQVKAGTHRLMASAPVPASIVDGTAITLRVDILGRDLTCFVNSTELFCFTSTDVGLNSTLVGLRQGNANSYTTPAKFSNFRVTTYAGPKWNFPRLDAAPSTQVVSRGPGNWDAADVNNPNVQWDPAGQRWVMYYSGYDGTANPIAQGLGLATAPTLDGTWTKDTRNPLVAASSTNVENGGLVWVYGRWLRASDNGAESVNWFTSPDLATWTRIYPNGLGTGMIFDAFLRVGQNGLLELWFGNGFPTAKIYRATSVDGGLNWSTPTQMLGSPPYFTGTTYRGNGEPSVYHLPGKEGVEYIVFADGQEQDGKGYLVAAFTVDAGVTWHWRNIVGGSGAGFDAYQKFDSYPVFAEGAFHLFHGAAPVNGNILNIQIGIGRLSVRWTPHPSKIVSAAVPYGLDASGALVNSTAPVISGGTPVGSVLSTTNGSWSVTPDSYTYQWYRAGVAVSGATSSTYTTVSADSGQAVTCVVTAVKATYTSASAASNTITPGVILNTAAPAVTGTNTVGSTLTTTNGSWSPTPDGYTYVWRRAGTVISGATSSTYTLAAADSGQLITCAVTAAKSGYTNATAVSNAIMVGGGTHDPSTISGLVALYRADSITGTADGATFATWSDTSGSGYTASALNSSNQPTYVASGIGGKPTARFLSQKLMTSALPPGVAAQTLVVVMQSSATTTTRTFRSSYDAGGLTVRVNDADKLQLVKTRIAEIANGTVSVGAAPVVLAARYDSVSGAWRFTRNGTAGASGSTPLTLTSGGNASVLFGDNVGASEAYVGDIAEMRFYNRVITDTELALVDSYVQDRYGITVSDYS